MSIEQVNKIDFIGIENNTSNAILTISDHMNWEDKRKHLELLQEKINSYLRFIESGEIYDAYPKAKGQNIIISIIAKHELPIEGKQFLDLATNAIKNAGFELLFKLL